MNVNNFKNPRVKNFSKALHIHFDPSFFMIKILKYKMHFNLVDTKDFTKMANYKIIIVLNKSMC